MTNTQKLERGQNTKIKFILTKLKNWNHDKTLKHKLLQNSNTQIVTKIQTQIGTKLKNPNWDKNVKLKLWQNSNFNKNLKSYFWQKSKTKSMTKLNLWQNLNGLLVRTTWPLDNRWDVLWAAFWNLAMFYLYFAHNDWYHKTPTQGIRTG